MNRPTLRIHPLDPVERDGWLRVASRIEGLDHDREMLWFDVEPSAARR
mgnify:CR=1 FL=1